MARPIAHLLQAWFDLDHVKWEATTDVVAWASAYGTDLERAWAECPRADYLMAIAGACKTEPEGVVGAACAVAREALAFVPAKHGVARKAVYLAETLRPGDPDLSKGSQLPDRAMALVKELTGEAVRLEKAVKAAAPDAFEAFARAGMRLLSEAAQRGRVDGLKDMLSIEQIPQELLASTEAIIEGALKENAVVRLGRHTQALYRMLASAQGARAAASSLTVALSHDVAVKSLMLLAVHLKKARGADETLAEVHQTTILHGRSSARVYSEAALVFEHAAGAFGSVAAAGEQTFRSAVMSTLNAAIRALGAPRDPADRGMFHAVLRGHAERAKLMKLADYADRVRAVVPYSALRPPQDDADREAVIERDPRGSLLEMLENLAPLARLLGLPDVVDAVEAGSAVLRATGKLNKGALAPVLQTIHERMAAALRHRARETEGAQREEALAGAAQAEEAVREMEAILAAIDAERPS